MYSFTPRSARISATVQTVIQTHVTKAIVETGTDLVLVVLQRHTGVANRRTGIHYQVGDVEDRLAGGMAGLLALAAAAEP